MIEEPKSEHLDDLATKLAKEVVAKMNETDSQRIHHSDGAFVEWLDKRIVEKLKLWAGGIILAYSAPIILVAFYIGTMNEKLDIALSDQKMNTQSLQSRGAWMYDQERFNCDIKRVLKKQHPDEDVVDCTFVAGSDRTDARR